MKRRLSPLAQGRLQEALWKRGVPPAQRREYLHRRLRESGQLPPVRRPRRHQHRARVRESMAARQRHRLAALARKRPDLIAMATFMESYFGARLRSRRPAGHSAIQTFKESYRRPAR